MKISNNIIKSTTPPINANDYWLDTSLEEPIIKACINGVWTSVSNLISEETLSINATISGSSISFSIQSDSEQQAAWWESNLRKIDVVEVSSGAHYEMSQMSSLIKTSSSQTATGSVALFDASNTSLVSSLAYIQINYNPTTGITTAVPVWSSEGTLEDLNSYGVEFDTSIATSSCTRIGSSTLHKSLPIQSRMKGCILSDDGEVVSYLPTSDWTSATRDGSTGQVMVEIPEFYIKFTEDGTKRSVRISEYALPGYHLVPKRYVSAYQATVDRTNSKLASVVNMDAQYRGCGNQSAWDGTYQTALGRPATDISLTSYRAYARARKSGSTAWNCYTYGTHKAIYWLYVIEYADLNCQAAYNAAKTSEGYMQGGLGAGVTNAGYSAWGTFNGYYPFIACGATDTLGNNSGVVSVTVKDGDDNTFVTTSVPRYRGIENPFGHIFQWTDGVLVEIGAASDTGLSKVYVASNPANFADTIGTGYSPVGNEARTEGYGVTHIFGNGGEVVPASVGGGSSIHLCDYHYTSIPDSGKSTRGLLFGGYAAGGASAGFASAYSHYGPSSADASIGSRLCFLPTTD